MFADQRSANAIMPWATVALLQPIDQGETTRVTVLAIGIECNWAIECYVVSLPLRSLCLPAMADDGLQIGFA
jgi:hypothetical protein